MEILINNCYGGFSFSEEALKRYADKTDWTYIDEGKRYGF